MPGSSRETSARQVPGAGARVLVGGRALGGDRVGVQQVPRLLRYQTHAADQVARRRPVRDRAADPHRPGGRLDQPDQRREQGGLPGAVAAHQRDGLAGARR